MDSKQLAAQAMVDYLEGAPGSLFAGMPVRVREHWVGADNLLWRVQVGDPAGAGVDAVAKLYLDAGWVRGRRQHDAHVAFAPAGLAPQPLWFDREPEGLPHQVVVYGYVEGVQPEPGDAQAMAALAQAVAQLHEMPGGSLSRIAPHPVTFSTFADLLEGNLRSTRAWLGATGGRLVSGFDALSSAARAEIARGRPLWNDAAACTVHGDLSLENALVHARGVTLLDWELSGQGDPSLEVARFLSRTPFATHEERARWLRQYLGLRSDPLFGERIAVYGRLLSLEHFCQIAAGLRLHGPALTTPEQSELIHLLEALFVQAGRDLDVAEIDPSGLVALLPAAITTAHEEHS